MAVVRAHYWCDACVAVLGHVRLKNVTVMLSVVLTAMHASNAVALNIVSFVLQDCVKVLHADLDAQSIFMCHTHELMPRGKRPKASLPLCGVPCFGTKCRCGATPVMLS